ncbi:protein FAR1-RELATED SEQUENCE 7 [Ricinus communis]|uniref:protein FAR1-RELATED SEQUENCE 7 n=1 Tax=Ricinus communis TaxID=3988 RepID=UPI00201ACE01|nr:protein FAR1-RELATED SEQUENCE 7 [Ricinus communis]XP_048230165.1 protein FAR1-RELATED SEQUENCE 7 [Ricinus communis]
MGSCELGNTSSYVQKEVLEDKLQASPAVETTVEQDHQVVESDLDFQSSEDGSCNDGSGVEVDGGSSDSPKYSSVNICGQSLPEADVELKNEEEETYVAPKVGMEFETEDHAYKCYSRYAVLQGFSIRKDFVNKSRLNGDVVSRRYTCYKQGYRPANHIAKVRKPRQETRTGCLAQMTIARQPNGKFRVTRFVTQHNHEFLAPSTAHMLPSQKRLTFAQAVEADLAKGFVMDGVPKLGMGFESEDHAYEFYNAYAGQVGFSVRKDYVNRSKIDGAVASRRFTCFREGFRQKDKRDLNVKRPRKETRIGCTAQLVISRQPDSKYRVTHFEKKHNHELVAVCKVRTLRSQKRLATAQVEGNEVDVHSRSL